MSQYDKEHWRRSAQSQPRITWLDRSEIASRFIRPGDVVLDLGAGAQTLRRFLPPSVGYVPVDCVDAYPDTWVADFNGEYELPNEEFNVITCIGLFSHLTDPEALLDRLARNYPGKFIIYTTNVRERPIPFERYISDISQVTILRKQPMFTGVLNPHGSTNSERRPLSDMICSHTPLLEFAWARWMLLAQRWRRGGNNAQTLASLLTL
jgi:hypothetical protein